ncbi:hypothetical protein AAFO92_14735 [Roseovarius sp. CAU 1744]|uniref:hypothetical protein n=1 Tax=Roseovarius sp. CAU 1744 TaxID=3140368 RepID=UPI00325AAC5E
MNYSQIHKPITIKDVYLSSLGFDTHHSENFIGNETLLPLAIEGEFAKVLENWSGFCTEMADWYLDTFSEEPIVLISAPTIEMCVRYQVPARRGFILRTLGRIIEEMGPESFVGIVDCKHDPLADDALAALANHWIHEFARVGRIPYPLNDQIEDFCYSVPELSQARLVKETGTHPRTD